MRFLLLFACVILSGCAREFKNAQGVTVARLPDDVTGGKFTYRDGAGTQITWSADRSTISTVTRANWKGATGVVELGMGAFRPESLAVPAMDVLTGGRKVQ